MSPLISFSEYLGDTFEIRLLCGDAFTLLRRFYKVHYVHGIYLYILQKAIL